MAKQKPFLNQADISLLKKAFATKEDLKAFTTKKDLEAFATKEDLDKSLAPLRKRLKSVEKDIKKIREDINMVIGFFDREYLNLKARVERIENFLKIPPLSS